MNGVVLFGTGSAIIVDVEESLHRAGVEIAAGVVNHPGESFFSDTERAVTPETMGESLRGFAFMVPIFTPGYRQQAASSALRLGLGEPFGLIDPTVAAPRNLQLGPGSFINAGVSVGAYGVLGDFVFVNRGAGIGHHARIGAFVSVGPGAVIAGQVAIGKGTMVGAGATVLPAISIGENAVIGAGSVVARDVPDDCLVMGNPARIVRRGVGGYKGVAVT